MDGRHTSLTSPLGGLDTRMLLAGVSLVGLTIGLGAGVAAFTGGSIFSGLSVGVVASVSALGLASAALTSASKTRRRALRAQTMAEGVAARLAAIEFHLSQFDPKVARHTAAAVSELTAEIGMLGALVRDVSETISGHEREIGDMRDEVQGVRTAQERADETMRAAEAARAQTIARVMTPAAEPARSEQPVPQPAVTPAPAPVPAVPQMPTLPAGFASMLMQTIVRPVAASPALPPVPAPQPVMQAPQPPAAMPSAAVAGTWQATAGIPSQTPGFAPMPAAPLPAPAPVAQVAVAPTPFPVSPPAIAPEPAAPSWLVAAAERRPVAQPATPASIPVQPAPFAPRSFVDEPQVTEFRAAEPRAPEPVAPERKPLLSPRDWFDLPGISPRPTADARPSTPDARPSILPALAAAAFSEAVDEAGPIERIERRPPAEAPDLRIGNEIDREAEARLAAIDEAIDADRIELHLQPIVVLPQRRVRLYEVLSRLNLENGDKVMPAEFLPRIHRRRLSAGFDLKVVGYSLAVARHLIARESEASVTCNLSAEAVAEPGFLRDVARLLGEHAELSRRLVLEIPQHVMRGLNLERLGALAAIGHTGAKLCIDQVRDFRIDPQALAERGAAFVKIPAKLLLGEDSRRGDFDVADLAAFLRRSGITLIADQVETEEMVRDLLDLDVPMGQGFVFAVPRPVRADVFAGSAIGRAAKASAPATGLKDAGLPQPPQDADRRPLREFLRRASA